MKKMLIQFTVTSLHEYLESSLVMSLRIPVSTQPGNSLCCIIGMGLAT